MSTTTRLVGIHHVNLSMPPGMEPVADGFYFGLLGLTIKPKPAHMTTGRWYVGPGFEVHLGVDPEFVPAELPHPAFHAVELSSLVEELTSAGVKTDPQFDGGEMKRAFVFDPFGNRIELILS